MWCRMYQLVADVNVCADSIANGGQYTAAIVIERLNVRHSLVKLHDVKDSSIEEREHDVDGDSR